jgi:hypothetical protein
MASGSNSTAAAGKNGCIVLSKWIESEKRYRVVVGYVGEDGIEPNVFYRVDDNLKLVKS